MSFYDASFRPIYCEARHTTATVKNIVKVHCNLCLVDNIEEISSSDANIDWSSDEDLD